MGRVCSNRHPILAGCSKSPPVCLVHLVCLVCLVYLVEPDQPDRPDEPNQPDEPDEPERPDRPDNQKDRACLRRAGHQIVGVPGHAEIRPPVLLSNLPA